jgi:hypothetical protein
MAQPVFDIREMSHFSFIVALRALFKYTGRAKDSEDAMSEGNTTDSRQGVDVKEAIRRAKTQVADLLEGEAHSQLGLEEVKFDDRNNEWVITLGLNRPWNVEKQSGGGALFGAPSSTTSRQLRTYKKVHIDGRTGEFVSMEGTD